MYNPKEFRKTYEITGNIEKHICCVCYIEDGIEDLVAGWRFPFYKSGKENFFCDKHAKQIINDSKLKDFEKLWSI
jgi:hypothetical protein